MAVTNFIFSSPDSLVILVADSGEPYSKCSFRASIPKARECGNLACGPLGLRDCQH
jgi:hypothetical protein